MAETRQDSVLTGTQDDTVIRESKMPFSPSQVGFENTDTREWKRGHFNVYGKIGDYPDWYQIQEAGTIVYQGKITSLWHGNVLLDMLGVYK